MKMTLHRFCSQEEFDCYKRGELLINEKDHSKTRGTATTSVGFCWFTENPEEAKYRLSGIVDFDVCITVETDAANVMESKGRYVVNGVRGVYLTEYCCTSYDNKRFRLVEATDKFRSYAPNVSDLKKIAPWLFV
ncbi:hypothetical protein H6A66_11020 [Bacteroides caecigallinarum]|uniref:hypothetical protein n=1 Tax=Bacteroides caecigallinarum TaxID=1411144 RepID=UPI0019595D36|nr:hypothetical protein [Bacteroides caecigallinarum]MBM6865694.1 hypothetical protein [Bacteroides caecigallinarum]